MQETQSHDCNQTTPNHAQLYGRRVGICTLVYNTSPMSHSSLVDRRSILKFCIYLLVFLFSYYVSSTTTISSTYHIFKDPQNGPTYYTVAVTSSTVDETSHIHTYSACISCHQVLHTNRVFAVYTHIHIYRWANLVFVDSAHGTVILYLFYDLE